MLAQDQLVRTFSSVPSVINFASGVGTPIVINTATYVAYFYDGTTVRSVIPDPTATLACTTIQPTTAYLSVDGTSGLTAITTAGSLLTIKNGLITSAT